MTHLRTQLFFPLAGLLCSGFLLLPALHAQSPTYELETLVAGLGSLTSITHAGDERLFVTLLDGQVLIVEDDALVPTPFLDLSDRVFSGGERGLLSIAFHPAFASNGTLFAYYVNLARDVTISRFTVDPGDPNRGDPASERILLTVPQPFGNHNGGQLQFGPDGFLYAGLGDGGNAYDPLCKAQDPSSLLGKMLRLDVDRNRDTAPYYAIPVSNPFQGFSDPFDEVRDEIWSLGLRNPWRFSFDRMSGELFIGDVGQDDFEEINWEPSTVIPIGFPSNPGGWNYGWKRLEGNLCLDDVSGCTFPVPPCDSPAYRAPILTYDHDDGDCSVTGGYVYRGSRLPDLVGGYLYGDFCSGRIWLARPDLPIAKNGRWNTTLLPVEAPFLTAFGEDVHGEIYLASGGDLLRLTSPDLPGECNPGPTTLCLEGGRFEVRITWRSPPSAEGGEREGPGIAVPLTDDGGYFWFFDADNPEIIVKVRNACTHPSNRFWFFSAGLTNVEVRLTVTDTETGVTRRYFNPQGRPYVTKLDNNAFATCP